MSCIEFFRAFAMFGVLCMGTQNGTDLENSNLPMLFPGYTYNEYWLKETFYFKDPGIIHIGTAVTLDFQTKHGVVGRVLAQSYRLYFKWLNEQGGLNLNGKRVPVKLVLIDDKSNGERVEAITEYLIKERGIKTLLSPFGSGLTRRAAKVAHKYGAAMVAPAAASTDIYEGRPTIFGTQSPTSLYLASALQAVPRFASTVAYIQENKTFSKLTCMEVELFANKTPGLDLVFAATVEDDAAADEIDPVVAQMKEANPDVVFGCVYRNVCHRILEATRKHNYNPKAMVFTICVTTPGFFETLGDTSNFIMGVTPFVTTLERQSNMTDWDVERFTQEYTTAFSDEPPYQAASAFASASALVRAIETAGTTAPENVSQALRDMDDISVNGRIKFDKNGQCTNKFLTVQIHPTGDIYVVEPPLFADKEIILRPAWDTLKCLNPDPNTIGTYGMSSSQVCLACGSDETAPYNATLQYRVCEKLMCPKGKRSVIFRSDASAGTKEGAFCESCYLGHFAAGEGTTQCDSCAPGTYQDLRGQSACSACAPGKYSASWGSTSCILCSGGEYTSTFRSSECKKCPDGATCDANEDGAFANFTNAEGYFLLLPEGAAYSDATLVKCVHGKDGKACVPGGCLRDEDSNEVSAEGPFCGSCRKGFGRTALYGHCSKCLPFAEALILCIVAVLMLAILAFFMFLLVLLTDFTRPRNMNAIICKQVINYAGIAQVLFAHSSLRVPVTLDSLTDALRIMQIFGGSSAAPFASPSVDCLFQHFLADHPDAHLYKVYVTLGLIVVPIWGLLMCLLFWMHRCYCKFRKHKPPRRSRLMTLLIVQFFILHLPNTELLLTVYHCHYFDEPRLILDTTVICNTANYMQWATLSGVGFILYSLGIPLGTYLLLRFYKHKGKLQERKTINVLGFLYSGFEPQYYYFEVVFMLRKVLYQVVVLLPGLATQDEETNKLIHSMALLVLAVIFLGVHLICEPFDNRSYFALDKIEHASLWAMLVTMLVQTWLLMSNESFIFSQEKGTQQARDIRDFLCTAVVVFFHLRFFCVTIYMLTRRNLSELLRREATGNVPAILDYGDVIIKADGLELTQLSYQARKGFLIMFGELAQMLSETEDSVSCVEFFASIQYMCVDALYHRLRDKHISTGASLEEVHYTETMRMDWKHRFEQIERRIVRLLHRCLHSVSRRLVDQLPKRFHTQDLDVTSESEKRQQIMKQLEELKRFNHKTFQRVIDEKITVEELHLSMLRISKEITKIQQKARKQAQAQANNPTGNGGKDFSAVETLDETFNQQDAFGASRIHTPKEVELPDTPQVDCTPIEQEKVPELPQGANHETQLRIKHADYARSQLKHKLLLEAFESEYQRLQRDHEEHLKKVRSSNSQNINRIFVGGEMQEDGTLVKDDSCPRCKAWASGDDLFCAKCGCKLKALAPDVDISAVKIRNEEMQLAVRTLSQKLDIIMINVQGQKTLLSDNRLEMSTLSATWQSNEDKRRILLQQHAELASQTPALVDNVMLAEDELFSIQVALESKRAIQARARPQATPVVAQQGMAETAHKTIIEWLT